MAVKSKTQLAADIAASTFSAPQQVILDDMVDSYEDLAQGLTTVQIAAIATPTSGQLVYNTDLSQFQYYNGTAWVSLAYGLGVPQTVQVTVSAAQLADLANTPVDLIAAQGAGLASVPLSYIYKKQVITTQYDFADDLQFCYQTTTTSDPIATMQSSIINGSGTGFGVISDGGGGFNSVAIKANEKLQLKTDTNPTTGDGILTIWINYVVISL